MKVTLQEYFSLKTISDATRNCWSSEEQGDNGGSKDKSLIERVGLGKKHLGIFEHGVYCFVIEDVSRSLLQEFVRHRIASLKVRSSRYTLKKFLKPINDIDEMFVHTGDYDVDTLISKHLREIIDLKQRRPEIKNDILKYALPEAFKTKIYWTINGSSLRNFLALRTSKAALWEIRNLGYAIFDALPEEHKFMYEDCLAKTKKRRKSENKTILDLSRNLRNYWDQFEKRI